MTQKWTNWDLNTPPVEGAVLTDRGWEIPLVGTDPALELMEVIVAIGGQTVVALGADIKKVAFKSTDLGQGDTIELEVTYNEKVTVVVGATIELTSDGLLGPVVLTAAGQTNKGKLLFTGTVPLETATLTLDAQTIVGTITDAVGGAVSDKDITVDLATAAGSLVIA